ncbi:MAG: hypothetical protein AAFQ42_03860 [Pseudomonadota bacterium]
MSQQRSDLHFELGNPCFERRDLSSVFGLEVADEELAHLLHLVANRPRRAVHAPAIGL